MLKAIVWKEWREMRWRIAFGTILLNFVLLALLRARIANDTEVSVMVWFAGGMVLAILSAMGPFAPETTQHTWTFYLSKPVDIWKVTLVKWFIGWLGLVIPLLVSLIIFIVYPRNYPLLVTPMKDIGFEFKVFPVAIIVSTMYYTLTCSLAPRRAGEAYVGLVGVFVLVAMMLHIMFIEAMRWGKVDELGLLGWIGCSFSPLFWIALIDGPRFQFWLFFTLPIMQLSIFLTLMFLSYRNCKGSA
ncbi:MAG: hypothetical protein WC975_04695 [Phycisphaerae bacterium]